MSSLLGFICVVHRVTDKGKMGATLATHPVQEIGTREAAKIAGYLMGSQGRRIKEYFVEVKSGPGTLPRDAVDVYRIRVTTNAEVVSPPAT